MREIDVKGIRIQGENLQKQAQELQLQFGPQSDTSERTEEDFNSAYPPDDTSISRLPAAIRGAKRFINNLVSVETEQDLEVGFVYAWDGIANAWVKSISKRVGVDAIGLAVTPHTLQFWGITHVKGAVPGRRLYLSASMPGVITTTQTRHLLGVGLAKDSAFIDTLRGVLK